MFPEILVFIKTLLTQSIFIFYDKSENTYSISDLESGVQVCVTGSFFSPENFKNAVHMNVQ
jgi:hypothetical protein